MNAVGPDDQNMAPRPWPFPRHLPHQTDAEGIPNPLDHGFQVPPHRKRRRMYSLTSSTRLSCVLTCHTGQRPAVACECLGTKRGEVDQATAGARVQQRPDGEVRPSARDTPHPAPQTPAQGGQEGRRHQAGGAGGHQAEGGERTEALEQEVREAQEREREGYSGQAAVVLPTVDRERVSMVCMADTVETVLHRAAFRSCLGCRWLLSCMSGLIPSSSGVIEI